MFFKDFGGKNSDFFPLAPSALAWLLSTFELGARSKSAFFERVVLVKFGFHLRLRCNVRKALSFSPRRRKLRRASGVFSCTGVRGLHPLKSKSGGGRASPPAQPFRGGEIPPLKPPPMSITATSIGYFMTCFTLFGRFHVEESLFNQKHDFRVHGQSSALSAESTLPSKNLG